MSEEKETDPIVIDEVVHIDSVTTEVKYERAEYAAVIFHNISETYPVDAHIECRYTVTSDIVPTTHDWVGLYRVGWMSPKDYIYYEWAQIPKQHYEVGKDSDSSVLFPAHRMPGDDGDFYQFCYVASSSQIRGASTPFQFRKPSAQDFVEIEDDETNMLVIRSKTVFLQENLQHAEAQKSKLIEARDNIQKERDSVVAKYQEVTNKLATLTSENEQLNAKLVGNESKFGQLNKEAKDMNTVRDELQKRVDKLNQDKCDLVKQRGELEAELLLFAAKMKQAEYVKDELMGKNANLLEQTEMYKNHFASSESTANLYSQQLEDLQAKLTQHETLVLHLKKTVETLTQELEDNRQNLTRQTYASQQDKERLCELEERLKNAEDKLGAAEESKHLLAAEIGTYQETQQSLSKEIERSTSECMGLKQKLCALEDDFTQKSRILDMEMDQTRQDLVSSLQDKERVETERNSIQQKLNATKENTEVRIGSMSVMKQSLDQIKQRLEKKERHCHSLEKTLGNREREFLQQEHDMRREIEDLKEKIFMCSEEYKALYIDKSKMQRKLERVGEKKKAKLSKQSSEQSSDVEAEKLQMSPSHVVLTETEPTSEEINRQVDDFERELDRRLDKKMKYKNLYTEAKEKIERLRENYEEQLKYKDEEIERLKKRIRDTPSQLDMKARILEKCVSEKEMVIEELNQKLRQTNVDKTDQKDVITSPQKTGTLSNSSPYPYYIYNSNHTYPADTQAYPYPCMVYPQQGDHLQYTRQQSEPSLVGSSCPYPVQMSPSALPPLKYPGHAQAQLLVYPHPGNDHRPQSPPRPESPTSDDTDGKEHVLDQTEVEETALEQPMTPLPPPMTPEVLPSAKKAEEFRVLFEPALDQFSETELKVTLPTAPAPEERFYDAEGKPMKFCQTCGQSFAVDIDDAIFEEHQLSHVVGVCCPICKMCKYDEMTEEDFTRHVNTHMDQA